ncbi:MAG TPA: efflux RND transporter periplasmic adaptor subunit [Gammaproteobacteria bacterium]|nr:efflux RND transporter periplasmic adaptor subunit [Gammaproteobacteria bacterium]
MLNKLFISLIVGAIIPFFALAAPSPEPQEASADAAHQIPDEQIYTVQGGTTSNVAVLGGSVIPIKMVKLISQMPGEVKYIAGEEGDHFKAGTPLVGLDTTALMEKRKAAVAGLNSANAGLANAQVQYRREVLTPNSQSNAMLGGVPSMFSMFSDPMRSMMGRGSPSYERHSNLFGQSVQIQTAQDQIQQALAGIRELDATIENTISIAPFDGVIVKKMVEAGDVVQPGMPLVVFADTSSMQIQVEVPAGLVSNLDPQALYSARLDHGDGLVQVKVARIFPMANVGGHTTTVKFELPQGTTAHAGMYAEIFIPNHQATAHPLAMIPQSAITWRGSLPAVFLVSKDRSSLKMRTLRIGTSTDNGMVSVLSGISIGDQILKAPLASTRSGPYQASGH